MTSPATYGDVLSAHYRVSELGRSRIVVSHELYNGETLIVRGTETRVWAVRHPHDPRRLEAQPIPPEVRRIIETGRPTDDRA